LWQEVLHPLQALNLLQPAFVLRDYHVDNLMVLEEPGRAACGVLDFQDALHGHQAYDLASLLQDARVDVPLELEADMKTYFKDHQPSGFEQDAFETAYTLLALQRSARILGFFLRRARRDGYTPILDHIPRVWGYIQRGLDSPLTQPLKPWFNRLVPSGDPLCFAT
jgi:aminoglycoside/choline kinase family phosphotransferase